jgi:hypothetical protein
MYPIRGCLYGNPHSDSRWNLGSGGFARNPLDGGFRCAATIAELLIAGHWSRFERLRGAMDPAQLLQSVPGIGPFSNILPCLKRIESRPAYQKAMAFAGPKSTNEEVGIEDRWRPVITL